MSNHARNLLTSFAGHAKAAFGRAGSRETLGIGPDEMKAAIVKWNSMRWKPALLALLFLCGPSVACSVPPTTSDQRFSGAKNVYVGFISSVVLDLSDEALRDESHGQILAFGYRAPKTLRLVVVQTLKGEAADVKNIQWDFCSTGASPELGSRVTAFESANGWYLDDGKSEAGGEGSTEDELDRLPGKPGSMQ